MNIQKTRTIRSNKDFEWFRGHETDGTWRAFKMTDPGGVSRRRDRKTDTHLEYAPGKIVKSPSINTSEHDDCGAGVNIASLAWLRDGRADGMWINRPAEMYLVEFNAADAVIPHHTDGKFRVPQVRVLYRVNAKDGKRRVASKKV